MMPNNRTPPFVEKHFVKSVPGETLGVFLCRHCDWDATYVRDITMSLTLYLKLAEHLLDEHEAWIGRVVWAEQLRPVSWAQVEP